MISKVSCQVERPYKAPWVSRVTSQYLAGLALALALGRLVLAGRALAAGALARGRPRRRPLGQLVKLAAVKRAVRSAVARPVCAPPVGGGRAVAQRAGAACMRGT